MLNSFLKPISFFLITFVLLIELEGQSDYRELTRSLACQANDRKDLSLKDSKGDLYVTNQDQLLSANYLQILKEPAKIPENQIFRLVITNWFLVGKSFCIIEAVEHKQGVEIDYRFYFENEKTNAYELHSKGMVPHAMIPDFKEVLNSESFNYLASWDYKERSFGSNQVGIVKLFTLEFRHENKVKVIDVFAASLDDLVKLSKGMDINFRRAQFDFHQFVKNIIVSFGCLREP